MKILTAKSPPSDDSDREDWIYQTAIEYKLKEEEYDIILEKRRVRSVVEEHAEMHPPYTRDCPICLEDIKITGPHSMSVIPCCGGFMCYKCFAIDGFSNLKCCPLCRGNSTPDDNERLSKLRAEKGHPLFQLVEGKKYMKGREGYPVDVKKGLEFYRLAVEQKHPTALFLMGLTYRDGVDGYLPQSKTKAIHFLKEAADLGYTEAIVEVAGMLLSRVRPEANNEDENLQNAVLYTTLAYRQASQETPIESVTYVPGQDSVVTLAYNMGSLFRNTFCGFFEAFPNLSKPQLLYRASHYLEEAARKGHEMSFIILAETLLDFAEVDGMSINSVLYAPRILFWARKAANVEGYKTRAIKLSKSMEEFLKQRCANCRKNAIPNNDPYKCCARCKCIWYCSKECQVKHWSSHKSDCIKAK